MKSLFSFLRRCYRYVGWRRIHGDDHGMAWHMAKRFRP